jgi:hypothetical protein
MSDEPNSETLRARVLQHVDPRGRPSVPGDSVEGYERKTPRAGTMEAAGIEPASPSQNRPLTSNNGFEHWKLDGEGGANVVLEPVAPSPSNFSAKTTICGIDLEVRREGKHLNLHVIADGLWNFEELETAIPKLACILAAARLAQEV